jgi:hypothetical protein
MLNALAVGLDVKLALKPSGAEPASGAIASKGVVLLSAHCGESKL